MSSTIQPNYGTRTYSAAAKVRGTKQSGTQAGSFLDLAAQIGKSGADSPAAGLGGITGTASLPASLMMDLSVRAYRLRMAKRADFMRWLAQQQIEDKIQADAAAAKSKLAAMMSGGRLQTIFGDEIAGVPTETVLSITQAQVWGGGAML